MIIIFPIPTNKREGEVNEFQSLQNQDVTVTGPELSPLALTNQELTEPLLSLCDQVGMRTEPHT